MRIRLCYTRDKEIVEVFGGLYKVERTKGNLILHRITLVENGTRETLNGRNLRYGINCQMWVDRKESI